MLCLKARPACAPRVSLASTGEFHRGNLPGRSSRTIRTPLRGPGCRVDTLKRPIYIEASPGDQPRARLAGIGSVTQAPVAQLDRAMAYGAIGWGFESLQA